MKTMMINKFKKGYRTLEETKEEDDDKEEE